MIGVSTVKICCSKMALLESSTGSIDTYFVMVGSNACIIGSDLPGGSILKLQVCRGQRISIENRVNGRNTVTESVDVDNFLSGQPEYKIEKVDRSAMRNRIIGVLPSPSLRNFL